MVKLVLMDMAGTTVEDPDGVGRCLKEALTEANIAWKHDEVNAIMGIPKPVAISTLAEAAGINLGEEDINRIHRRFQSRMLHYYRTDPEVKEIEGATSLFRTLKSRGIKVALDTGFDRSIVEAILERLNWGADLLDATVASDEVSQGRPYPDLVYRAMELTGVSEVGDVAKVGDTPSDLGEGTAAGCGWVIGVTSGTHREELLLPHPHTHLIHSIRELPSLFGLSE